MLLAISIFVAIVFFAAFLYSVRSGQYDDIYTPSVRMLFEDELVKEDTSEKNNTLNQQTLKNKKPVSVAERE